MINHYVLLASLLTFRLYLADISLFPYLFLLIPFNSPSGHFPEVIQGSYS